MFGGRVKTLNPLIYSSLLYIRDDKIHKKQFQLLKMPEIDIVVVNLYPFKKYLKKNNSDQIIEMYRMMLDTVWVDDIIDPSEVALLARKRKELDISFETHMELVREMLEDSD